LHTHINLIRTRVKQEKHLTHRPASDRVKGKLVRAGDDGSTFI